MGEGPHYTKHVADFVCFGGSGHLRYVAEDPRTSAVDAHGIAKGLTPVNERDGPTNPARSLPGPDARRAQGRGGPGWRAEEDHSIRIPDNQGIIARSGLTLT